MAELEDLREFQTAFDEYKTLLDRIGERVGGEHRYAAATAELSDSWGSSGALTAG